MTVIAAFPATGKSYYASRTSGVADSDSSTFSRGPEWPGNYVKHIRALMTEGGTVLVSTHAEVRTALFKAGIPYTLVYPIPALREEYRERMERRGSPAALIKKVCDELWDDAILQCARTGACVHVVLRSGEYLTDVLERPAQGSQSSGLQGRQTSPSGPLGSSHESEGSNDG